MAANLIVLFLKASATAPGSRWITVHPHGPAGESRAVLIQPAGDGSYHVIGGAGGSLNYLKLRNVKSVAEYAKEAKERHAGKQEAKKRQRQRDKEAGHAESKSRAREAVDAQLGQERAKLIKTVADAMGWKAEDMAWKPDVYQNATEAAMKKGAAEHAKALMAKVMEAAGGARSGLLAEAEENGLEAIGEIPLTSAEPDQLSVQDIDPIQDSTKGFGFATEYGKRAEAAGLTDEALAAEAAAAKPPVDPDKAAAKAAAKDVAKEVAAELEGIADRGPKVDAKAATDLKQKMTILKAVKAFRASQRDAAKKKAQIDDAESAVEASAYVIETGPPADAEMVKGLENDLRTIRTRSFLAEAEKVGGTRDHLMRHIGAGAFNSVNAMALATTGAGLIDRSVVDVLGVGGAAEVIARRLRKDLSAAEVGQIAEGMQSFHNEHYMRVSEDALREARELQETAVEIEMGEAHTGADLAELQALNAKRREFASEAQRELGTALGEMEGNAALVYALGQKSDKPYSASLGKTSIEDGIRQLRAIGLQPGDYKIERAGASTVVSITPEGMERLATPIDRADLVHQREALDIINGRRDEAGWLPEGTANRPDIAMDVPAGVAQRIAEPLHAPGEGGVEQSIRDYIGGRAADGDAPADIMAGLLNDDTQRRAGDRNAYMAALDKLAPMNGPDGKMIRAESHADAFQAMADEYVQREFGAARSSIGKQQFRVDDKSVEALHRALAAHPDGVAAFKAVGDLTPQDQAALRNVFVADLSRSNPEVEEKRAKLAELDAAEPESESTGMFGPMKNPEHTAWKADRNALAAELNAGELTWGRYVDHMGSPAAAYASMQDTIRSKVLREFAEQHNKASPGKPLRIGRSVIANDTRHTDFVNPVERERREADRRALADRARNRSATGEYQAGGIAEKLDAAREAEEATRQSQMGLFGEEPVTATAEKERPLGTGERWSIGQAAERQVAGMMGPVGKQFEAGKPVKLWQPSLDGKYVARQRAVKLIQHNKKMALGLGMGSGKTAVSLMAMAHLHSQGAVKRGLFLVPSATQAQFGAEALTVLQPGKYSWHCKPGADRAERIRALKDPSHHFVVTTHQSFRDDMLHLAGQREGVAPAEIASKLDSMAPAERKAYMKNLMAAEGIDADYLAVDEGHNTLNRAGKDNSSLANVVDATAHNASHYVSMSADPVKNDPSEAFDVLAKMDPAKYHDRDAFMRKYGVDTPGSRDALMREMASHLYTAKVDPGVKAAKTEVKVPVTEGQRSDLKRLDAAAGRLRLARMSGEPDIEAAKVLSPRSFDGVPEDQHAAVATKLAASVGIVHNTATMHALNGGGKVDAVAKLARERRGKPGVVFAHNIDRVQEIADRLTAEGHRAVVITGKDSAAEKARKMSEYKAGKHDVLVASDAAAVGTNLQHGKWLAQFDTPMTAMLHAQRGGRIHRVGQTEDVELLDLVSEHPAEARNRARLTKKYGLREVMTSPLEGLDDTGLAHHLQQARAGKTEAAAQFVPAPAGAGDHLPTEDQESLF